MKENIELRKMRDFGQVFNDSFTFFKENFKPLLRALFVICGVFLLLGTISSAAAYMNMSSVFNFSNLNAVNNYDAESHSVAYLVSMFINVFVILLTQGFIYLVTLCYISAYLQNGNQPPTLTQVWGFFKYYFWRVLGASILVSLLAGVGICFCIIPGIYLSGVFSLVMPIMVMENGSFSFAFNKSFRLIRDNWWFVFGVIFVMSLIVGIASSVASIPLSIIPMVTKFVAIKSYELPLIIFFSILKNLLMVFYCLTAIAVAMCYFDLSEKKEGTGLLDRIEGFGKPTTGESPALPSEEY